MTTRLPLAAGALALAGALLLGACSGSDDHGSMGMDESMPGATAALEGSTATIPADAAFNATDVAFAQGMIPHHAQAVEMADMALGRTSDPELQELARAIKQAQQPEIDQMTGWLEDWGQPVPSGSGMDHDMDGMGGMMMAGMMSAADMERLGGASGRDFEVMWLEMMIQHHEGAITMANDELADGKFEGATQLAQAIVTAQQAEIEQMETMIDARQG